MGSLYSLRSQPQALSHVSLWCYLDGACLINLGGLFLCCLFIHRGTVSHSLSNRSIIGGGRGTPTGSRNHSRDSSRNRDAPREPEKPAPPPSKDLSEADIEKKTKAIIDEYLHLNDQTVSSANQNLNDHKVRSAQ